MPDGTGHVAPVTRRAHHMGHESHPRGAPRKPATSGSSPSYLQSRLDALLQGGVDAAAVAEELLPELVALGECEAVIAVWDELKSKCIVPSESAWAALERLHSHAGKDKIAAGSLAVPQSARNGRRTLAPGRRLHKIMKGRRMSARSESALEFVGPATAWVATERAKGRELKSVKGCKARISLAKELQAALNLPSLEVARGVVTKLKQKKVFKS